ncbi:uncharacterized protein LOC144545627 [Carex rostrata]
MTRPSTSSRQLCQRGDRSTLRNWSDLPDGLLHTILTCLCSLVDFISFSSVCRSWRAITSSVSPSWTTSHLPPLLLCPTSASSYFPSSLRLLDPTSPSFSSLISRISNKFEFACNLISYSHGHLFCFMPSQNRIVVLNPLTGDELSSPLLLQNYKTYNFFPVLISPLSSPDSGVVVFTSDALYHWHIGSPSWSSYCPRVKPSGSFFRMVAAIMQGKVYVVDCRHTLFVLDLSPQLHLRSLAVDGLEERDSSFQHFLVVCDGELLLLLLVSTDAEMMDVQLEAYRFDSSVNGTRWVKQETLGNWAIFVGYDSRAHGLAIQNPERWGGRKNCVSFTTGYQNGDWPWAVIKLGDVINTIDPESPLFIARFGQQHLFSWVHPGF